MSCAALNQLKTISLKSLTLWMVGLLLGSGKAVYITPYRWLHRDCNLCNMVLVCMATGGGGKRLTYASFNAVALVCLLLPPGFSWTCTGYLNWLDNCSVIPQPCTNNNNNKIISQYFLLKNGLWHANCWHIFCAADHRKFLLGIAYLLMALDI
jgi:hypothetical protein